ncbi:DNA recombination protein RmuC [Calidifontibacter sp. DB0510]|uniref:DNA recombination protein RmuC n=1 Tax=Metallococcus carri TaxID=1656884 RepID=A0A967AY41_9MICO|nr:DNA recombination protein RmuC [Metallococcus carri]NHN55124.1 DNA recombination protein RmuC [Metallococcus carri]NOP36201.1 DNA recombination protein RmuC [Calidifontibacter sp. DB2511S]
MTVLLVILAFVLGSLLAWLALRSMYAARLAALTAERDLLHARVEDLSRGDQRERATQEVLAPLASTLQRVERQVSVLERDRVDQFGALEQQLSAMGVTTDALREQTASLSGALRSSTTSGLWGEVQLRRVLEHAGLLPQCDFEEQVSTVSAHDRAVRPDVVVRLPGDRSLVIDAKAPVTKFLDAQATGISDDERDSLLGDHAAALRRYVDGLAGKAYWTAFRRSPELVLCFVPADAVLAAAVRHDPGLVDRAMRARVVLVSPSTLLAALQAVSLVWQQDSLSRNAEELLRLGQELYARLSALGDRTSALGASLRKAVESYNAMVGTLESRVLVSARRMNDLGVASSSIAEVPVVEATPRVLTARELIDALGEDIQRPMLDFEPAADDQVTRRDAG